MPQTKAKQDRTMITGIVLLAFAIGLVTVWAWWKYLYTTPQNVFERMLNTSLSTPSVTKQTVESTTQQNLDQTAQLSVNPIPSVRTETTASQAGSQITTESLAFPDREYFRYTSIDAGQADGQQSANEQYQDALNIWGFSGAPEGGQLFDQTLLGVVPIARLNPADKRALIEQIKREAVYTIDYSRVEKRVVDGRSVYTYPVALKPRAYVNMLKSFSAYVGTDELASVDVNQYPDSPTLDIELNIDVWSGQLRSVSYADSSRIEVFSAHGAYNRVSEPAESIPLPQLQSKLQ
jgi:hypothetical protein